MDFNADLGESFGLWRRGADEALMAVISSANVACGFHAGDPAVMRVTLETARRRGVAVGAHPGLPDLLGFGRRAMAVSPGDVRDYVLYQMGALDAFARAMGLELHHVKPHGALYTMALEDARLSRAIVEAVAEYDERLPIYTLAGSETWHAAQAAGIRAVPEFFADRPLRADGLVIGLTVSGPEQAATIRRALAVRVDGINPFGSVQATWNLLEPSAGPALAEAHAAGLGVILKEVLANGRLSDRGWEAPDLLRRLSRERRISLDRLAVAAALANPWADVVLTGAVTVDQLAANLEALDLGDPGLDPAVVHWTAEAPDLYWAKRRALPWR